MMTVLVMLITMTPRDSGDDDSAAEADGDHDSDDSGDADGANSSADDGAANGGADSGDGDVAV